MNMEEYKIPFDRWKDVVVEESISGAETNGSRAVVRVFVEVEGKGIAILCPEDGKVIRRNMETEPYVGLDDPDHKDVRGFTGLVRRGDVIDVGEGGTYWDKTVRWGVVMDHGRITWLNGGTEEEVISTLTEASKNILPVGEQNKRKKYEYIHNDEEYNELYRRIMGTPPF